MKQELRIKSKSSNSLFIIPASRKSSGFTLIELILYVALVSIFISGAILFAWDLILGNAKSAFEREVNQNLRFSAKRISYEIRQAAAINSLSSTDLCVSSAIAARNPTRVYRSGGQLRLAWGGGSSDCTAMTNDRPLTSNQVSVTDLEFTDLSASPDSQNIQFSLTVAATGDRQEWQTSGTYETTVEIRQD